MLIFGLQNIDGHAAAALEAMGETSALPYLRTALPAATGDSRVSIAKAINNLSHEDESFPMANELISVLAGPDPHWGRKNQCCYGTEGF
jgi:hypothetical protein